MGHAFRLLWIGAAALVAVDARAYRPFDGTDADVAARRHLELEIGPVGYLREGPDRTVVAPALVANYGFAPRCELVLEGRQELEREPQGSGRPRLTDTALSVKAVVRRGMLQDESGPSIAVEPGLLLPATGEGTRVGGILSGIVSLRGDAGAIHLNVAELVTHEHRVAWLASTILEGPDSWPARPVLEVLATADYRSSPSSGTRSVLVGTIARAGDSVSLDVGFRFGQEGRTLLEELRAGFTWSFGPR